MNQQPDVPVRCERCNVEFFVSEEEATIAEGSLYCSTRCEDLTQEHDAAYESEAFLRNMEGCGDYEGSVTWP